MNSFIFIYYSIINFNDIFTLILYMMDELMKIKINERINELLLMETNNLTLQ